MNYVFPKNYEKSVPLPTHADKVKYSNQNPISLFEKVTRILEESLQYSSNPLQPVAFSCDDILQELQSSLNEGASRFATAFPISTEEIDENEEFIDSEDDEDDDSNKDYNDHQEEEEEEDQEYEGEEEGEEEREEEREEEGEEEENADEEKVNEEEEEDEEENADEEKVNEEEEEDEEENADEEEEILKLEATELCRPDHFQGPLNGGFKKNTGGKTRYPKVTHRRKKDGFPHAEVVVDPLIPERGMSKPKFSQDEMGGFVSTLYETSGLVPGEEKKRKKWKKNKSKKVKFDNEDL
ncbi:hypothetical protein HMI54_013883 [Coelomomyces lativittatus]|nr:hypothetical protein HMI56_006565 [Coelomomyces lativittatus]KAJ1514604.1 hypothetical protein HMI54_013883 [Coelomomyces lativittatus]